MSVKPSRRTFIRSASMGIAGCSCSTVSGIYIPPGEKMMEGGIKVRARIF